MKKRKTYNGRTSKVALLCHCPMCQEVSLTLSMVHLGRKTNFKQADGSSIYIVNHKDVHTMYDVTIYEKQQRQRQRQRLDI